ncbi:hypothetical protein [Butyrivibrio sp. YAB3001]|nr:hypothetical protein [Butyrivibrio sp. YAB3001]
MEVVTAVKKYNNFLNNEYELIVVPKVVLKKKGCRKPPFHACFRDG